MTKSVRKGKSTVCECKKVYDNKKGTNVLKYTNTRKYANVKKYTNVQKYIHVKICANGKKYEIM